MGEAKRYGSFGLWGQRKVIISSHLGARPRYGKPIATALQIKKPSKASFALLGFTHSLFLSVFLNLSTILLKHLR